MKKNHLFDYFNIAFMIFMCLITLYPIWYVIVLSFNDGNDAMYGGIYLWPRKFTLDNYAIVFKDPAVIWSFIISVLRTVIGTACTLMFTAMTAYAWGKKELIGKNVYTTMGIITMFFGGGLIPTFLVIKSIGLYNNFLVYIIPALFAYFNIIIFQTFLREIPASLEESAKMDGAGYFKTFLIIILPLTKPVLATIALFHGVSVWNDFFTGSIYVKDSSLEPIATYLYRMVVGTGGANVANTAGRFANISAMSVTSTSVRLATMIVATFPVMVVYPFLQKYFVKGVLVGGVKE